MDFSRIESAMDIGRLQSAEVAIVGCGGASGLAIQLARCGVRRFFLIDPDQVTPSNVARQAHDTVSLGRPKVEALADMLARTNPDIEVRSLVGDINCLSEDDITSSFAHTDLLINATDRFTAHARGNEIALRLGLPAIWVGLYPQGLAGEVVWWAPHVRSCYRCLCAKRYAAHERAEADGRNLDPSSDGCSIFDITLLDSIAGAIGVGLLTRGANNRFGRLVDQLGNRNFLQVQLDPSWTLNGRNPIRELLRVDAGCPAWFAWTAAVQADPDAGGLPCPDCKRFLGRRISAPEAGSAREEPGRTSTEGPEHVG